MRDKSRIHFASLRNTKRQSGSDGNISGILRVRIAPESRTIISFPSGGRTRALPNRAALSALPNGGTLRPLTDHRAQRPLPRLNKKEKTTI
jgi:hypothetical protein